MGLTIELSSILANVPPLANRLKTVQRKRCFDHLRALRLLTCINRPTSGLLKSYPIPLPAPMLRLLRGCLIVALKLSVLLDLVNEDPGFSVPQVRFLKYLMGFTECSSSVLSFVRMKYHTE